MNLRAWLDQRGRGATAQLARQINTRWATIYEIANGHVPKAALAKKIEDATGGEVSAAELLGITAPTVATASENASPDHAEHAA